MSYYASIPVVMITGLMADSHHGNTILHTGSGLVISVPDNPKGVTRIDVTVGERNARIIIPNESAKILRDHLLENYPIEVKE